MAKPQNVLIGKTKGSVGDATFTTWKGENVLKSKAVNNYSNPTTEQLQNNSKFGVMSLFAKQIAVFILAGFRAMAVKMTEYNAFSKANPYSVVISGVAPNYFVNPTGIKIAQGPELPYGLASVTKDDSSADILTVQWSYTPDAPANGLVYAAAFRNSDGLLLASSLGEVGLDEESLTLTATGIGTNKATTTVLVFYVNQANGKACDSIAAVLA